MIKVEFQVRGSSYIHSFLWIADAPVLTKETIELHKQSANGLISAKLPDHNQDPELYKLVKTYTGNQKNVENFKIMHVDFVLAVVNLYLVYE